MKEDSPAPRQDASKKLRDRAERALRELASQEQAAYTPADALLLLHELQIHRVELEMQNEELLSTRDALEKALARYTELYEHAPSAYLTIGREGAIRQANPASVRLLNKERDKLQGMHIQHFLAQADRTRFNSFILGLQPGEPVQSCEMELTLEDNSRRLVKIDGHCHSLDAGCHLILSDLTEHRRLERQQEQLQARIQQAQRLESVGRLAGGVAHDFNNMLQAIVLNIELTRDQLPEDSPLRDNLTDINDVARRSAHLIEQLITFARRQAITPKVIDLNDTIPRILKMLQRLLGEDVDLQWNPAREAMTVHMDPAQTDCIMANLCLNARDAIHEAQRLARKQGMAPGSGRIDLLTKRVRIDATGAEEGLPPGEYVVIRVKDNGCGMNAETKEKIFEPFFTTKAEGEGTGLGLATVHGIVHQNKGTITVTSQLGEGTTVDIWLPACAAPAPIKTAVETASSPRGRQECVLIVEDEPAILASTSRYLKYQGYTVHTAGTPREALEFASKQGETIDLLLTDVIMPEMNGAELCAKIMELRPSITCLFMSGYSADILGSQGVLRKHTHFIPKPFTCDMLATKIREVLDGRGTGGE